MAQDGFESNTGQGNGPQKVVVRARPTIIIGVGGTGLRVLPPVKHAIRAQFPTEVDRFQFRVIDVDTGDLERDEVQQNFRPGEIINLSRATSMRTVETLRNNDLNAHLWWPYPYDPRLVGNGCHAVRAAGRLTFSRSSNVVWQSLASALTMSTSLANTVAGQTVHTVKVIIVGSICGGTGSGMLLDIAFAVRQIIQENYPSGTTAISAYLLMPEALLLEQTVAQLIADRVKTNAYAFLLELDNINRTLDFSAKYSEGQTVAQIGVPPFDVCYLIGARSVAGSVPQLKEVERMVSDALRLELVSPLDAQAKSILDDVPILHNSVIPPDTQDLLFQRSQRYSSACVARLTYPGVEVSRAAAAWAANLLCSNYLLNAPEDTAKRTEKGRDACLQKAGLADREAIAQKLATYSAPKIPDITVFMSDFKNLTEESIKNRCNQVQVQLGGLENRLTNSVEALSADVWKPLARAIDEIVMAEGLYIGARVIEALEALFADRNRQLAREVNNLQSDIETARRKHGYNAPTGDPSQGEPALAKLLKSLQRRVIFAPNKDKVRKELTEFLRDFGVDVGKSFEQALKRTQASTFELLAIWAAMVRAYLTRAIQVLGGESCLRVLSGEEPEANLGGYIKRWASYKTTVVQEFVRRSGVNVFDLNSLALPDQMGTVTAAAVDGALFRLFGNHQSTNNETALTGLAFFESFCAPSQAEMKAGRSRVTLLQRLEVPKNDRGEEVDPLGPGTKLAETVESYCAEWARPLQTLDLIDALEKGGMRLGYAVNTLLARAQPLWSIDDAQIINNQTRPQDIPLLGIGGASWEQRITEAMGERKTCAVTGENQTLTALKTSHGATAMMLSALGDGSEYARTYEEKRVAFERLAITCNPQRPQLKADAYPVHTMRVWQFGDGQGLVPFRPSPPSEEEEQQRERQVEAIFEAGVALKIIERKAGNHWYYPRRDPSGATVPTDLNRGNFSAGFDNAVRSFKASRSASSDVSELILATLNDNRAGRIRDLQEYLTGLEQEIASLRQGERPDPRILKEIAYMNYFRENGLPPGQSGPLWIPVRNS